MSAIASNNPPSPRSRDEYESWMSRVKRNGNDLQHAPAHIRNDKKIVLAAVQQKGFAVEFASPDLRNDKQVVLMAVRGWGMALQYTTPQLQNDRHIVMAAIKQNFRALSLASQELQDDKQIVLEAVRRNVQAFLYASCRMKQDEDVRDVVCPYWISKVRKNGWDLQSVPAELRNEKKIVLAAVQTNGQTLQFASPNLRNKKDVVLAAVKSNPDAIKFANKSLQSDKELLIAAGMFDEDHEERKVSAKKRRRTDDENITKKIALSTRFSLDQSSWSEATNFTKLLKRHKYIQMGDFKVYAPNAFDKKTCDPNWTDFEHPCRGTKDTCQFEDGSLKTGYPTDDCCWRYSYRYHLEEANDSGGFMLQLIETGKGLGRVDNATLGNGQKIERDMAQQLKMKIFHVYRPTGKMAFDRYEGSFDESHIEVVVTAIKRWYDEGCKDMSECVVRPTY